MISEERALIIDSSLRIEQNLSILLSNILYINDIEKSKTLGNKSSALSFNTKLDLLLDTEYISPESKKKFQFFMEVRNQFAHNKKCNTFFDCLEIIDRCENRLNKFCPPKIDKIKSKDTLKEQFSNLISDLNQAIKECHNKYIESLDNFVNKEFQSNAFEELNQSIINNISNIDNIYDFPITKKDLKKFIAKIYNDSVSLLEKRLPDLTQSVVKRKLKELE